MAMVMIALMIVLVMVNIVPAVLDQVDLVCQRSCKTFQQLIDFHQPNASQGKLNSSRCVHLSAAAQVLCGYAFFKQTLKEGVKQAYKQNIKQTSD
jgi:hypothetical protein